MVAHAAAHSDHKYFEKPPLLEWVRQLRNGLAHGNKFFFDKWGIKHIGQYPAHNPGAPVRSSSRTEFEVVKTHHENRVLFDFMLAGDVLDLLQSSFWHNVE